MSEPIRLTPPLTDADVERLRAGDRVLLTGTVYTARDAAHARLVALIEKGEPLPFDPRGQIIYFVGPTPAPPGRPIGSAGPTTSYRMDPYSPVLVAHGLKGMIGKGKRSAEVKDALKKHKAVYFGAVGGAAALISKRIRSAEIVAYEDLGPEAIRKLEVEDFPVVVVNDAHGGDLYEEGRKRYGRGG
ncbi:MAG: Fe-S-containing hydro-lyase [Candidatus Dadabacteria bacterium]|nr:MAG: Fe-S-containing hydro-lyase [Candidatus Dadabacteria bacterium]